MDKWLKGLVAAFIGGAVSGAATLLTAYITHPAQVWSDMPSIGGAAFIGAILLTAGYITKSPFQC